MTKANPSNRPTVYILAVPTSSCPPRAYHICRFPPPRSGPVARKSTSTAQFACISVFSVHIAPRTLPGVGGVRTSLSRRMSGGLGLPSRCQFGTARRFGDMLVIVSRLIDKRWEEIRTCHCAQSSNRFGDMLLVLKQRRKQPPVTREARQNTYLLFTPPNRKSSSSRSEL